MVKKGDCHRDLLLIDGVVVSRRGFSSSWHVRPHAPRAIMLPRSGSPLALRLATQETSSACCLRACPRLSKESAPFCGCDSDRYAYCSAHFVHEGLQLQVRKSSSPLTKFLVNSINIYDFDLIYYKNTFRN
jgi:hypothetical protein